MRAGVLSTWYALVPLLVPRRRLRAPCRGGIRVSVRPKLDRRGFRALLAAAKDRRRTSARRDYFLIYLAGRTGLRASELLALRVRDLHLDTDPAFVSVSTLKQRKRQIDQVLLEPRVVKRCRTYLRRVLPKLHPIAHDGSPLFPGPQRPPLLERAMSIRNVDRIFAVYARRARLRPGVTFHALRHYRGWSLLTATGDVEFTRQQLRHRFLSSTQRYLGVTPEQEARYLRRLDKAPA